jgi:hypothetical protein
MIPVRTCLAILSAMVLAASPLRAAPGREALVIGNGTYTSLPAQPACLRSAHAVAMALRNAGFDVVENEDATSGGIDAAIGAFSKKLAEAPDTAAVIYACAYAAVLNDRPFLLPVSARITRPADVLTQGVLAKSLIDALARGNAGASVFALDVVPAPGTPAALGLDSLAQAALPDQLGLIAVNQNSPPEAPTPLAALLVTSLRESVVQVGSMLSAIQQQLGTNRSVTVAALHQPARPGYLVGAAPPMPAAPAAAAATPAVAPTASLPADEEMADSDRRRVQASLAKLGYYDGRVDGVFGPETRAAIRRYQHELGADMTGRLTAAQATRLAAGQ